MSRTSVFPNIFIRSIYFLLKGAHNNWLCYEWAHLYQTCFIRSYNPNEICLMSSTSGKFIRVITPTSFKQITRVQILTFSNMVSIPGRFTWGSSTDWAWLDAEFGWWVESWHSTYDDPIWWGLRFWIRIQVSPRNFCRVSRKVNLFRKIITLFVKSGHLPFMLLHIYLSESEIITCAPDKSL